MKTFHEWLTESKDENWPKKIKKGGLREKMGLATDEPLEDQVKPEKVAAFFKKAVNKGDKDVRGKVMFAVNSNQDKPFWKKVGSLIKEKKAS